MLSLRLRRLLLAALLELLFVVVVAPPTKAAAPKDTSETTSAGSPCRCELNTDLPTPDYYNRSTEIPALCIKNSKDMRDQDSDKIIRSNPQSKRGFLASWQQPGQLGVHLVKPAVVSFLDAHCNSTVVTLKPGEAVHVKESSCSELPDRGKLCNILVVDRCGNKVTAGDAYLPPPQTVERIVTKEVERIVKESCPNCPTCPTCPATPPVVVKKRSWCGRHKKVCIGIPIVGGAGTVLGIILNGQAHKQNQSRVQGNNI